MWRLLAVLGLTAFACAAVAADEPNAAPRPGLTTPADVSLEATGPVTSVKLGEISGSFPVGRTVIQWTATDAHGNTTSGTHTVVVTDTTPPRVVAPANVTVEATGPATPIDPGVAAAEDIVDGRLVATPDKAGPFAPGVHTLLWSATDNAGNAATATQTVTIADTTPPSLAAPADVTVEGDAALTAVVLGDATVSDVADQSVAVAHDAPTQFPIGTTKVTWTARDASGNVSNATQTITVTDTTAPDVSAPEDITLEATGAKTALDLGTATATDRVDGPVTARADQTGPFSVGVHTVTWSARDQAGNTGSATQTVTVTDTTAPTLTPPADITTEATGPQTDIKPGRATATDLVDGDLTPQPDITGPFAVGTHTVTWRVTDQAGNTTSAAQTITITDTTPPKVTPPAAISIEATGRDTAIDPGSATAHDLVDGDLTPQPDITGPFAVGEHTLTWRVTDQAGNTGSATQTIVVRDTTAPALTTPADVTAEATHTTTQVQLGMAAATDIVDAKPVITNDAPGAFPVGTTVVTWRAADVAGNVASAAQRVTITDTTPPSVTPPRDVIVEATGPTTVVDLGEAVAGDLVDGDLRPTPDATGPFAPGVYTITWRATDKSGNTGSATQPVTVTDKTPPRLVAAADVTVEAGGALTPVALKVSADDLVDGVMTPQSDAPDAYPVGTTTVTWTVTDRAGNSSRLSRSITVVDTRSPSITAPADVTLEATGPVTAVELGAATANDIVDGALTPTPDQTGPFAPGIHTITWSVTDQAGNLNTATQRVLISDKTAPQVTAPPDVQAEATGPSTPLALGSATAVDRVDGDLATTPDKSGPFGVGVHRITWSATDAANNTGTAVQTVTVVDTTPPTLTPPPDVTLEATGTATAVTLGDAIAHDSVDGALNAKPDTTGPFAPGVHTVTWRAADAAGNAVTATQTVTVTDTTPPSLVVPADVTIEATAPLTAVDLGKATATDNIDRVLSPQPDQPGPFAPGRHTITWSVADSAGNTASATQLVTVTDTKPPEIQVPDDVVAEAVGAQTAVDPGVATAFDLVDGEVAVTSDAPALYPVDTTVITWRAKDNAGNESSLTQFVTVEDRGAPVVTPPPDVTVAADGDETDVALGSATAIDLIDGELDAEPDKTGPFAVGVHTITWTATDSAGKKGTATQTVTIVAPASPGVTDGDGDAAAAEAPAPDDAPDATSAPSTP